MQYKGNGRVRVSSRRKTAPCVREPRDSAAEPPGESAELLAWGRGLPIELMGQPPFWIQACRDLYYPSFAAVEAMDAASMLGDSGGRTGVSGSRSQL